MKIAFSISSIEEYGKLMAYCIQYDINVFRTYWDEREKGERCYIINISQYSKNCEYSSKRYFIANDYTIVKPVFHLDAFGKYVLTTGETLYEGNHVVECIHYEKESR